MFVFRVIPPSDEPIESTLAKHAKDDFIAHCKEKGILNYNMKIMYVYHVDQLEHIFVMDKKDCDRLG